MTAEATYADLIIHHARIYTVDPHLPWASTVAVRGERILDVGDELSVMAHRGPATRLIDARVKLVLPGFLGSH